MYYALVMRKLNNDWLLVHPTNKTPLAITKDNLRICAVPVSTIAVLYDEILNKLDGVCEIRQGTQIDTVQLSDDMIIKNPPFGLPNSIHEQAIRDHWVDNGILDTFDSYALRW